jgi:hypothetical protein
MSWSAALDFQVHGRSDSRKSDDSRSTKFLGALSMFMVVSTTICLYMALLAVYLLNF